MPIKRKSILKISRKEVTKTIFAMLFYVCIVGPIVGLITVEKIKNPIITVLLGLPIYIFGMIIAKKREFISILPIMLGISSTLFCFAIGNIDKIIIKYSDLTIATILPLILSALIMMIDLIVLFLYCMKTNNEKIQKYLFIPFVLLNITSIAMVILTLFQ